MQHRIQNIEYAKLHYEQKAFYTVINVSYNEPLLFRSNDICVRSVDLADFLNAQSLRLARYAHLCQHNLYLILFSIFPATRTCLHVLLFLQFLSCFDLYLLQSV